MTLCETWKLSVGSSHLLPRKPSHFYDFSSNFRKLTCFNMSHIHLRQLNFACFNSFSLKIQGKHRHVRKRIFLQIRNKETWYFISAFVVRCQDRMIPRLYIRNFKILAGLCSWAVQFVSCLVGDSRRHIFSWRGSFILLNAIKSHVKITFFPHFPIFSDPTYVISLAGTKTVSGSRFVLFVIKHLLSIFVKHITFMHILVWNAGNQKLKLINFTCFQILLTVPKLSPLTNIVMLCVLDKYTCFVIALYVACHWNANSFDKAQSFVF